VKKILPQLDALIAALAAGPHCVCAFIPELEPARRDALRSRTRIVSEQPMRLAPLLADCDLFVSQGGNVAVGTLMAGVPQLVLPMQYEQYITARRIEQIAAGLWLALEATPAQVATALQRVLHEPGFAAAARAFSRRYPAYSPAEQQRRIVARIEEIVASPSRWPALPVAGAAPILTPTATGPGAPR
jgi:spore coat polysaccharide biosynthesis predicted glycosyltransferase SpsG